MLYVTTRNHLDSFTACPVLKENRAPDGGLFVPLHVPKLSQQDCARLAEMSFGQCAAEMLNLFFSTRLTGWDVDFAVGRYPVRLEALAHKIYLAEYKRFVEQTVVYDRDTHLLIGIMRDITNEENDRVKKENISRQTVEVADRVVEKQMRIVQEIASLLGETAAETKIALTKLKESIKNE